MNLGLDPCNDHLFTQGDDGIADAIDDGYGDWLDLRIGFPLLDGL